MTALISTTVLAVVLPVVSAQTPTSIGTTTATLKGLLIDTGGASTNCTFIYGPATGVYPWIATTTVGVIEGQIFTSNITGLTGGTNYFVKAVAYNSSGNATSTELPFTTTAVINPPASLNLINSSPGSISVKWPKASGASVYYLRYKTGTYADNITLGTLAYEGPNTSYSLSGLTPGTPYYFSVWGKDGSSYSATYAYNLFSTTSGTAPSITTIGGTTPLRAFDPPSTAFVALNPTDFPYSVLHPLIIRWSGMAGEPTEAVIWAILAVIVTLVFAIGAFILTRMPMVFLVTLLFGVFMGYQAWLFPGIAVAAVFVIVAGMGWSTLTQGG